MAIVKMPQSCTLSIKMQAGVSGSGTPVYRFRNYGKVKTDATDEAIYAVATGLIGLQSLSAVSITRQDNANLMEE